MSSWYGARLQLLPMNHTWLVLHEVPLARTLRAHICGLRGPQTWLRLHLEDSLIFFGEYLGSSCSLFVYIRVVHDDSSSLTPEILVPIATFFMFCLAVWDASCIVKMFEQCHPIRQLSPSSRLRIRKLPATHQVHNEQLDRDQQGRFLGRSQHRGSYPNYAGSHR